MLVLVAHFAPDILTVLAGAEAVDDGIDALQQLTFGRVVVDVLRGRDEADTELLQLQEHRAVLFPVAVHAAGGIGDDVVHVPLAPDALHHLAEDRTLGHRRTGVARFQVFVNYDRAKFLGLALDGLPLGGQGDAFGVVVRLHLALSRYAK
ncbi:hypothetical protein RB614_00970 [Phytohabitans sp. ZYX-F-186]|uniref:Secreted protein n=1 Tax=Phytohabitans maris TaxID=3071409 RepID=A0ABU0Z9T9_9ACTN|nr:hypothetical protein [Phytohabitans sp. ZYX-F-186]MDQ7903092.1 hypothetical protein [Phytohabitans sp. ZYX-F-186]